MKRALLGAAAAAILAVAGCTQEPPPPPKPAVKIYAMNCGALSTQDADMFADDGAYAGQQRDLVDPCYLISHPTGGDLLWDAGLPDSLVDAPGGLDSGPFHLSKTIRLADQLAQLQLTPADIEFISFSHSHFDHIGAATLFTNATWLVDAEERAYMFRDEARRDLLFSLVAPLENYTTALIEGEADYDVFGDGSVKIIQAPGHTPGHTVLWVETANSGAVLLTGDMWHMAESRANKRVPRFNTDRTQTLASMDKIEALATASGARVVRQHVPEDFAAMPVFPAALE